MMKDKIIDKSKMSNLVKAIAEKHNLFAPVKQDNHHVFARVTSPDEVDFQYANSLLSPKRLFLPQSEELYRFRNGQVTESLPSEPEKRVVMFIRPCDARALAFLDRVFGGTEFDDPYYLNRRENTTVVALACNRPLTTCFCTSVGGGPADEGGSDVLLFDLGESFLIRAVTQRGEDFIRAYEKLLGEAKKPDLEKAAKGSQTSEQAITCSVAVKGLKEKLDEAFDSPLWEEIHRKCLGCGTCTYLCSTCYCFDVTDEVSGPSGRRVRSWDSCMYPLFTLHASGHNPRPSGKERMRQRIMHKFNYCPENFEEIFCVGCGRCVRECPVNLDIRKVIENV
jgi:ferredoxin